MLYDAVLSLHTNPLTCGVAKHAQQLAEKLGVPLLPLAAQNGSKYPLVSLKVSEAYDLYGPYWMRILPETAFDLLLHDRPRVVPESAHRVFYADEIGCPATVRGNPTRGAWRVLTYGFAHKRVMREFVKLKARLEREHPDYTLSVSMGIHEGTPWDETITESVEELRALFGDKLRVLGYLADDALAKEIQDCDAVAAFFVPALRKNNTSVWAAVEAGKQVYTNTDEHSPPLIAPTWDETMEALNA